MRFTYCPHCGTKLGQKEIGDEGMIPFCEQCNIPLWDMFTTSIIVAVVNEYDEVALLRQNYVSATNYVCVAGIMKIGESAASILLLPAGILQCTLGMPFGMFDDGASNFIKGLCAPFELVYQVVLLPVRIISLGTVR